MERLNATWVSMGSNAVDWHVAAVTTQGSAFIAYPGNPPPNPSRLPGNSWRSASTGGYLWLSPAIGVDTSGRIIIDPKFNLSYNSIPALILGLATIPYQQLDLWYVTTDGIAVLVRDYLYPTPSSVALPSSRVHAVCAGGGFACFLTTSGRAVCTGNIIQPGGQEPLVELVCGVGGQDAWYACGLTASGDITCFGPQPPSPPPNNLKFKSLATVTDARASGHRGALVCGITFSGELHCWGNDFNRTFGPPSRQMLAANTAMFCSVDTSD